MQHPLEIAIMTFFEPTAAQFALVGFGGLFTALLALLTYLGRTILKRMDQLHLDNLESRRENRENRRENREDHQENSRQLAMIRDRIDENQKAVYAKIDENQKAVYAKIDENQKAVNAKIDENQKAVNAKIDENQKAVNAKIDENQRAVNAKIDENQARTDANQKAIYVSMDEDRQQNQARFEELATMFKHLDGKVESMMNLLAALVTGKTLPEAFAGQRKTGPAE